MADLPMEPGPPSDEMAVNRDAKQDVIPRDEPTPHEERRRLVDGWNKDIKEAKAFWSQEFDRMRADQNFALGLQWSNDFTDDRYVVNVTHRLIQQRVAQLYAKNPKAIAKRRERLLATVWDGTQSALETAMQTMQTVVPMGMTSMQMGMMPNPMTAGAAAQAGAVIADAEKVRQEQNQIDKMGKTLELLYQYEIDEQIYPFKTMMKNTVRRSSTNGVGYLKLGFQRAMEKRPEITQGIADAAERLAVLERITADIADDQLDDETSEMERLRLMLRDLQSQEEIVVREGLLLDFPSSTSIIPDTRCQNLKTFLGCDWVAQEYLFTHNEIKEIYNVDVGGSLATLYKREHRALSGPDFHSHVMQRDVLQEEKYDNDLFAVWEVYCRKDGLVYHICDGYTDFLREPTTPEIYLERFWPWFALVLNEVDNDRRVFPPSDVNLIRHQQKEINRMREAVREHRIANRPLTAVAQGLLDEEDKEQLQNRPGNSIVELQALQPNQSVDSVLQTVNGPGLDPNLYEVQTTYDDIMRVTGMSEAAMGMAGGGVTATEVSQAEQARGTALASSIDELNDFLSEVARAAGQVLLLNVSEETVKRVVGPGAVWPTMSKTEVAQELYLEIEAGSAGRPNQLAEIQNMERLMPFLLQMPGLNPEYLLRELLKRLDDDFDMQQAFLANLPSVVAQNAMMAAAGRGAPGGTGQPPPGGQSSDGGVPGAPQGAVNSDIPSAPSDAPGPPPGGVAA